VEPEADYIAGAVFNQPTPVQLVPNLGDAPGQRGNSRNGDVTDKFFYNYSYRTMIRQVKKRKKGKKGRKGKKGKKRNEKERKKRRKKEKKKKEKKKRK
jgi:hypothetical protein